MSQRGEGSAPDRDEQQTPGLVVGAVAAATVVVPFLIVYAVLFLAHGLFLPVEQPDVTGSRQGEAVAGAVAAVLLGLVLWGMLALLNGSHRVVFWFGQLVVAGAALALLLDPASGQPEVPVVVLAAAVLAIVLSLAPPAARWVSDRGSAQGVHRRS